VEGGHPELNIIPSPKTGRTRFGIWSACLLLLRPIFCQVLLQFLCTLALRHAREAEGDRKHTKRGFSDTFFPRFSLMKALQIEKDLSYGEAPKVLLVTPCEKFPEKLVN